MPRSMLRSSGLSTKGCLSTIHLWKSRTAIGGSFLSVAQAGQLLALHYTPDELVQPLIKHSLDYIIEEKLKETDKHKVTAFY